MLIVLSLNNKHQVKEIIFWGVLFTSRLYKNFITYEYCIGNVIFQSGAVTASRYKRIYAYVLFLGKSYSRIVECSSDVT